MSRLRALLAMRPAIPSPAGVGEHLRFVLVLLAAAVGAAAAATSRAAAKKVPPPHVVVVVADDLGWFNAGFTQQKPPSATATMLPAPAPHLQELATSGAVLGRLYSYHYCSPARSAVLTGRLPVHVFDATPALRLDVVNHSNPATGVYGIPPGMDTIAHALSSTHIAHMVGKFDVGFANESQMPTSRGFKSFWGYLGGMNDYVSTTALSVSCGTTLAMYRIVPALHLSASL